MDDKGRVSVIGDLAQPAGLAAVAGVQLTHACLILPKNTEIKGREDFLTQVVRLVLLPKILPIINMAFCFNLQKKKNQIVADYCNSLFNWDKRKVYVSVSSCLPPMFPKWLWTVYTAETWRSSRHLIIPQGNSDNLCTAVNLG